MGKTVIVVSAEAFAAAETIEQLKALGQEAIVIIDTTKDDLTKALSKLEVLTNEHRETLLLLASANTGLEDLKAELNADRQKLAQLAADLEQEVKLHELTKVQSAGIITDLKDQLNIANANIGSELPIVSYKGKKLVVAFAKFHLPKDTTQYTLEDLKQGKKSEALIEKVLAIKGQALLSEAAADK